MPAQPFTAVSGRAAAMREDNIDTDIIFPARFLLITTKVGLGDYAFHDRRFASNGSKLEGYVLNDARFAGASIIIAGANFGSGSSREQAVWALAGLSVRAVVSSSFGEIFQSNCMRNGIVPIVLPAAQVAALMDLADACTIFTVDLERQELCAEGLAPISFSIPPERRLALLHGWDETDQIVNQFSGDIEAFEIRQRQSQPWLYTEEFSA